MLSQQFAQIGTGNSALSSADTAIAANALRGIVDTCRGIGLIVSALQLEDAATRLTAWTPWTGTQVAQLLIGLNVAINAEMSTHLFMRIFPERAKFYEQPALFGQQVNDCFPSASRDIRAAGSCYATDRNTACVMHLMRILELGLNVLATQFSISFSRENWENIINDVEKAISVRYEKGKPTIDKKGWQKDRDFYAEAAKDFRYFKNAWRNHAMHVHEHYDPLEALSVLDHVKTFMDHLAENGLRETPKTSV